MKKITFLFFAFVCTIVVSSCMHKNVKGSIKYNETKHTFSMKAYFPESKTREVEEYMNHTIGTNSNMSFINAIIDGNLALDDHTTFYIKKSPDTLYITLDKDRNSDKSYQEIKSMCLGLKNVLDK